MDYMVKAAALEPQAGRGPPLRQTRNQGSRFRTVRREFDGLLSPEELRNDPILVSNLRRFDENGDGRLDPAEFRKAEATLEAERMAVQVDDPSLVSAVRTALGKVPGIDLQSTKIEAGARRRLDRRDRIDGGDASARRDAVKRIAGIKKIDNRLVSGEQMGWD